MLKKICPKRIIFATCSIIGERVLFNNVSNQICVQESSLATISEKGYVIFDFGAEICGGIRLLSNNTSDCAVNIVFGESVAECMAENGYKNAVNAHSIRVFNTVIPSYSDIKVGDTGFRFVKLELLEDKEIKIKSLYAENKILDKKPIWQYSGTDNRLKDIYVAAKRTVDLCASGKYVWDGIKRDRLVWAGDLYSEMIALVTLYGRLKKIEDTINFSRKNTPLPGWMNNLASYSAWWVITLADYYKYTAYRPIVEQNLSYLEGLADFVDEHVNENGEITVADKFLDLSLMKTSCEDDGIRALYILACNKATELLGDGNKACAVWKKIKDKLNKKQIYCHNEKSLTALKFWAKGELSESEKNVLLDKTSTQSTFMSYFVFDAVRQIFGKETAISEVKEYFGAMLDLGATTFWENFDPSWGVNSIKLDELPEKDKTDFHGDYGEYCYKGYRMSLCHGWSAGIIKLIRDLEI